MGSKGREIVGLDVDQLLELLRKAFATSGWPTTSTGSGPRCARGR